MPNKWNKLAGELLHQAADEVANHGCNDWKWPKDWTLQERRELVRMMVLSNCHKTCVSELSSRDKQDLDELYERCKGDFGPDDWWVMSFLGKYLQNE